MNLASIRLITDDVARLVDFYEHLTGITADRPNEDFAELRTDTANLAIGSTRTVGLIAPGAARAADNHSVLVEFLTDDVDRVHRDLVALGAEVVMAPTTMPWGNRSLVVRDPDGTLVNVFSPVTAEAAARFAR